MRQEQVSEVRQALRARQQPGQMQGQQQQEQQQQQPAQALLPQPPTPEEKQEKKIWRLRAALVVLAVASAAATWTFNLLFLQDFALSSSQKYGNLGVEPKFVRAALYEFFLVSSWGNYCQVVVNTLLASCFVAALPVRLWVRRGAETEAR